MVQKADPNPASGVAAAKIFEATRRAAAAVANYVTVHLSPSRELIGLVAISLTLTQLLSGIFVCFEIRKKGHTADVDATPFVGGLLVSLAMMKYGGLLKDPIMVQASYEAILLNSMYCVFYFIYSAHKWREIGKMFVLAALAEASLWGYVAWEDQALVAYRYGFILTGLVLLFLAIPLRNVYRIIKDGNASGFSFIWTLLGISVTFAWMIYGLFLTNYFLIMQCAVSLTVFSLQLIFMWFFITPSPVREQTATETAS